jgi:uncharacterized protein YndB with AHSA1/START domain
MSSTKPILLNLSTIINAPVETVWHKMLDSETYKIWTAAFEPGSFYEGSWDLGSDIIFKSGQEGGLAGKISQNEYLKVVEITYKEMINNDGTTLEMPVEFGSMSGLKERYTFSAISDVETKLDIYLETLESFSQDMADKWPLALEKLKAICE